MVKPLKPRGRPSPNLEPDVPLPTSLTRRRREWNDWCKTCSGRAYGIRVRAVSVNLRNRGNRPPLPSPPHSGGRRGDDNEANGRRRVPRHRFPHHPSDQVNGYRGGAGHHHWGRSSHGNGRGAVVFNPTRSSLLRLLTDFGYLSRP